LYLTITASLMTFTWLGNTFKRRWF